MAARKPLTDEAIAAALKKCGGNRAAAARLLGCSRATLSARASAMEREDYALWRAVERGDRAAFNNLARKHLPLCRRIVEQIRRHLPAHVDDDGLLSAAQLGLVHALERYDISRGPRFSTYAAARIRGAILDELRGVDHVPRLARRRAKLWAAEAAAATHELGRPATDEEVIARLGWSADEMRHAAVCEVGSLESVLFRSGEGHEITIGDTYARAERNHDAVEEFARLTRGVSWEARVVIWSWLALGRTMAEIGAFFLMSESRVSQLVGRAIAELRERHERHERREDDGVALEYVATYSPEDAEWVLTFEGAMLASGSLGECLAAAKEHERL